ncbi:prolyl-tRNA synthetase [Rhizoctonia solani]|uniref:proline--tRNA ligase n=1 Tax=Rhizoctonia solani TaxID=456999 RepID=A0A8H8P4D0_9AGAM|nr:prolyl-tRNA synthetase [Rhizoctonia solani]QRW23387.1 prolyl-tRNA synthetase [Rhizoctonia solani]
MVATDELTARLSALSLAPSALAAHPAVSNPGQWKEALGLAPGVPSSFELCKTLVFKPKTAKSATPVPVVAIARDETETSSGALAKKFNLKDLRLATDDLLKDFFALDKDSLVLDSTIAGTSAPLALHASSPEATVFLSGKDIATYLTSLETAEAKVHVVDFAALKAEAEATPGGVGPVGKAAPAKKAEDAKIEGAVQIAIGVKKELDFPTWYTNVLIKAEMIDYYTMVRFKIKELDVENSYFPMFVSSKVLEREKDHIEGFAPEVAWVTRAGSTDLEEPIAIRPTSETVILREMDPIPPRPPSQTQPMESVVRWEFKNPQPFLRTREFLWQEGHTAHLTRPEADKEVRDILDLYRRVYEELLAVPVIPGVKSEKEKFAGGLYTTTVEGFVPTSGRGIQGATSHCLGQNFSKMFNISVEDPNLSAADKAKLTDPEAGKAYVWQNSWGLSTRTIGVMVMVHGDNQGLVLPPRVANVQVVVVPVGVTAKTTDEMREKISNACSDVVKTLKAVGVRAKADLREGYTPGYKFNDWEQKGVPIRLEIGPLDLEKSSTLSVRRDTSAKSPLPLSDIQTSVPALLETIQADMFARAKAAYDDRLKVVNDWSQLTPTLEQKCVVVIPWCEQESCEDAIKDRSAKEAAEQADERSPSSGAKSLCIPFDQERWGALEKGTKCVGCGAEAKRWTMFGRSY